ncbi:MAG TPA: thermonuclease family protein [Pseudolabrys sp.]|nr:thermonuclease family protein [Pseudolabrys sp.]
MFLSLKSLVIPQRGGAVMLAAAGFAAGLTTAALLAPVSAGRTGAPVAPPVRAATVISNAGHPADVLRVIDGDTFEARVHVWPGMEITTRVRLRGIDAPEIHARCEDEREKAVAAREALAQILSEGAVGITQVGQDKYGGRVDATVSTARTRDVSAAMLDGGFARRYSGGRRGSWCG